MVVALLALALASCSGGESERDRAGGDRSGAGGTKVEGGTATLAAVVGPPTYIFPIPEVQYVTTANTSQFIPLMYRGLVAFDGIDIAFDDALIEEPEFNDSRTGVTLRLREWNWSDGEPITTRDVEFYFNLLKANKDSFAGYVPGFFPDNIERFEVVDESTIELGLSQPVNTEWFIRNNLGIMVPMPQHAWGKTGNDASVTDGDRTEAGADAIFTYLTDQAKDTSTYDSNPLWQVVSGPWKLDSFSPDGKVEFVPNQRYSGANKPILDRFVIQPYTSATARVNALRSDAGPDVAALPYAQLDQVPILERDGYSLEQWPIFGFNYLQLSFAEPEAGPIFRQLYFRQALQLLVDQRTLLDGPFADKGRPISGVIPAEPENPYSILDPDTLPPFDPAEARDLLEQHGWEVEPDGVSTCVDPGPADDQCGPGVPAGAEARFEMLSEASPETPNGVTIQSFQSEAAGIGIKIDIKRQPFNSVYSTTGACAFSESACTWQISQYDGWGYGALYPSGEFLYRTGGKANFGRFSDEENDENIDASLTEEGTQPLERYQRHLNELQPVVFLPGGSIQTMVRTNLKGVTPLSPSLGINPERWYFVR